MQPRNAFGFLLDRHALSLPLAYQLDEYRVLAPYLETDGPLVLPFWKPPASPQPTIDVLTALNAAIRENLGYERRDVRRRIASLMCLFLSPFQAASWAGHQLDFGG